MTLNTLSDELCTEMNRHLDVYDLASLSATCRKHYTIIRDADFMNRLHSVPVKSPRGVDRRADLISSLPRSGRKAAFLQLAYDIPKTLEAAGALKRHVDQWIKDEHQVQRGRPEHDDSSRPHATDPRNPILEIRKSRRQRHRASYQDQLNADRFYVWSPSVEASLRADVASKEIGFIKEEIEEADWLV